MKSRLILFFFIAMFSITGTVHGKGYMAADNLWIKAVINTDGGPIDGVFYKGGENLTDRGDTVVWGYFYADPDDVSWGSQGNPDLYVKIWFDVSGRIDVNFFHVSVPDIVVYTEYPYNGSYDKRGTATMDNRYVRHEYWEDQDTDITIDSLVGTYRLSAFTIRYSSGLVVTQDDVAAYSGAMTISSDGNMKQDFNIGGNFILAEGDIEVVDNNTLKIFDSGGCVAYADLELNGNFLTTTLENSCGTDFSETDVWEKVSSSVSRKKEHGLQESQINEGISGGAIGKDIVP